MENKKIRVIMRKWPHDVKPLVNFEMKPLVNFEMKIGLIWPAKSACTFSILWFFAITGQLHKVWTYDKWPHSYRGEVFNKNILFTAWWKQLKSSETHWIRVMRDPFKRAVSSYRHFLLHDLERERVSKFLGSPVNERGLSFQEFLGYLETRDIKECDIHFRQQWEDGEEFCLNPTIINADRSDIERILFKIQKIDDKYIKLFLEIKEFLSHHNAVIEKIPGINSSIIIKRTDITEKWPGFSAFDDAKTRKLVEKIYCEDYERFSAFI